MPEKVRYREFSFDILVVNLNRSLQPDVKKRRNRRKKMLQRESNVSEGSNQMMK